jgi:hypothetical protein
MALETLTLGHDLLEHERLAAGRRALGTNGAASQ